MVTFKTGKQILKMIADIKDKLDLAEATAPINTWINHKGREFYIDENGIACEILENGDSTSNFEVPKELQCVLKKESAQDVGKT